MATAASVNTIGAGATNPNVFAGQRIRLIPNIPGARFQVTYLSTADAAGLLEEVFVGSANPVEQSPVSPINRFPQTPEDTVATFAANPGEEITVRVANPTGGGLVHNAKLVVTRVA